MREKLKYPFWKLRNCGHSKQGMKEEASPGIGEDLLTGVPNFTQDAEDMRVKLEKFEGFLTHGQLMSGAAFDFSTYLKDMALCMMDTFGEIVEEEIGNIFNSLAKVQFEMSKLLQQFAAHVSETIVKPTETMMSRIKQAVIMKDQYDAKQKEYIVAQMEKQKGKSKRFKSNQANQLSIMAKEIRELANALNLYMQSLMQEQSESLATQAVKYHSAQMRLFTKGLASINAVEPMMRQLALDKTIDRGLSEEEDVSVNKFLDSMEMDKEGKISLSNSETDSMASSPRHLSDEQIEGPKYYSSDSSEEFPQRRASANSKSAPISPLMHHRREGKAKESSLESGHERVFMYALPPLNGSGRWVENETGTRKPHIKHSDVHNLPTYYSGSILEARKQKHVTTCFKEAVNDMLLDRQIKDQFVQMQQQEKGIPSEKPDFFVEDAKDDDANSLSMEKNMRYTQSGPLIDNAWTFKNSQHATVRKASSTAIPKEQHICPQYKSGPISGSPMFSYTTCNISPPPSSVLEISELYKLPLPPPGTVTPPKSPSHAPITFSAPLGEVVTAVPSQAGVISPLPSPIPRSLSIPASTTHGPDTKKDL